ncbi:MAG: hypothetical protein K0U34_02060 [Alphaproteobacteria bacterium]|nr:hypothetical protein [Alphaproteobacteria bacterium]
MLASVARILFGLIVACLVAGLVQTAFVVTPADLAGLSADALPSGLANAGLLSLFAATHSAIFVAPFGIIAAALAEWQQVRQLLYYALVGIAIAMAGLFALHLSEVGGLSILNPYAMVAYFMTGLAAGSAYWLVAGRFAGGGRHERFSFRTEPRESKA